MYGYDGEEMNKYQRQVPSTTIDIYDILNAYRVTCTATQHAIKKLLQPGERGHKDKLTDLREALASVELAIQMAQNDSANKVIGNGNPNQVKNPRSRS